MGIRARRSTIITLVEDGIAVIIMFARILLQIIRGVIVGMFHFICREGVVNMGKWWEYEFTLNSRVGVDVVGGVYYKDILCICADICLAGGSLVVVMGIMFLQLVFLMTSV